MCAASRVHQKPHRALSLAALCCVPIALACLAGCASSSQDVAEPPVSEQQSEPPPAISEPAGQPDTAHEESASPSVASPSSASAPDQITLLFAGDVMAHEENYSSPDFEAIWDDVRGIVGAADLAFMNLEAPVADNLPFSTYPNFNMNSSYPLAAIEAGFNVISLVNNHSNDQGLSGIEQTRSWAASVEEQTAYTPRPVHFSGMRETGSEFSYCLIEQGGWRVLFLAVSEILNRPTCKTSLNYVEPKAEVRFAFLQYLAKLRRENPCDLFVLSIHSCEDEYVVRVSDERRAFYRQILESGVDVLWANHPHVIREVDLFESEGVVRKLVMYGMGNTISGQRRQPNFASPRDTYNGRGDGLMMKAVFERDEAGGVRVESSELLFVTTLIEEWGGKRHFSLKRLDEQLLASLRTAGNTRQTGHWEGSWARQWAAFLAVRLEESRSQAKVRHVSLE